jgi:hypothetical protein
VQFPDEVSTADGSAARTDEQMARAVEQATRLGISLEKTVQDWLKSPLATLNEEAMEAFISVLTNVPGKKQSA